MTVYRRFSMKLIVSLLVLCMLAACFCAPAFAAGLKPDDKEYEDGNIVLHKQAERIGPDKWEVNVQATIKEKPVQPPRLEVVFVLDTSNSMLGCTYEAFHNAGIWHNHDANCPFTEEECNVYLAYHSGNSACQIYTTSYDTVTLEPNRYDVAIDAIKILEDALPFGTDVERVIFSINSVDYTHTVKSFDPDFTKFGGATWLMNGVNLGLQQFNENSDKTQIMIIVTDGEATNGFNDNPDYLYSTPEFEAFDGKVFTVGFNHDDPNLKNMVKNGGAYFHASNPGELTDAFTEIAGKITAMLVDPMGSNVGFEVDSVKQPSSSVNGEVLYTNNTLLWTPSSSTEEFSNATIAYSYNVKLNDQASWATGAHTGVALNNPTDLRYGISGSAAEDMETAAFPIPEADYEISSVQVNWEYDGRPLKTPTETETIISDWHSSKFNTDYSTITQTIQSGGTDYHYTDTIITRDGMTVDAIDLTQPGAYVVTHKYSLEQLYPVTYEYIGDVPDGAPDPSAHNRSYKQGDTVPVAENPSLEHWVFSGWTVAEGGAVIGSGAFTMPGNAVKLTGSWSQQLSYKVEANYFTSTDGGEYVKDNANPVLVKNVTYTTENGEAEFYFEYNGNRYERASLSEGSASAQILGNSVTGISPAAPTAVVTINLYRSVSSPARYFVTHEYSVVDPDGNKTPVHDDKLLSGPFTGSHGDIVNAASISVVTTGHSTDDTYLVESRTPKSITLDKAADKYIAVTYLRHEYRVETEGDKGVSSLTETAVYKAGKNVSVSYTIEDGYKLKCITVDGEDKTNDPTALTFSSISSNHKVIVTTVVLADAVVHFVDENGNTLRKDMTDPQYVGSNYDVTSAESVASISVGDVIYDFVSDDTAQNNTAYSGIMPEGGTEITRVYAERGKAAAIVHYVDGNHNTLQGDTTDIRYIGSPYDVADAQTVLEIIKDGMLYRFIGDDTASTSTVYSGTMPQGGVKITRVYELVEYYYQIQYNYTGYDAKGNEIYTNTETGTVSVTTSSSKTVYPEASRQFDGYDFTLVSETEMTADLTGTSEDAPYVFVIEYEFTEKPDPALVNLPKTGDRGIGRWIALMAVAFASMAMLIAPPRRRKAHR